MNFGEWGLEKYFGVSIGTVQIPYKYAMLGKLLKLCTNTV